MPIIFAVMRGRNLTVGFLAVLALGAIASCKRGSGRADVSAYLDFQDMASREVYARAYRPLREKYGAEVGFEVVPHPLPLHPRSKSASVAIECARDQGRADPYTDALMESFSYSDTDLNKTAERAGLDKAKFSRCLGDDGRKKSVDERVEAARSAGILAIPTVVVGENRITGQKPLEVYERAILSFLGRPVMELKTYGVRMVVDPQCPACEQTAFLKNLKDNFYPQLEGREVSCGSEEGRKLIEAAKVRAVPLYLFEKGIEDVSSFAQIRPILDESPEGFFVRPDAYPQPLRFLEASEPKADYVKGRRDAKVRVVEFLDFHCGHCAQFAKGQLPELEKKYVDTGVVQWAVVVYPLSPEHQRTAEAAYCADRQSRFWEYHDRLFDRQKGKFSDEELVRMAEELGLKRAEFEGCLKDPSVGKRVTELAQQARDLGVNSTPTFFVGDIRLRGARSVADFQGLIEQKLKGQGKPCAP